MVCGSAIPFIFLEAWQPHEMAACLGVNVVNRIWFGLFCPDARITCSVEVFAFVASAAAAFQSGLPSAFVVRYLAPASLHIFLIFCFVDFYHMKLCQQQILASEGEHAACSAFDGLCDAVVVLNDNMTLALPSPRFAALVLRHEAVGSLRGRVFTDFLIPGDAESFNVFMSEPPDTTRHASSHRLQVQFRTDTAGLVTCEVYHVRMSHLPSIGAGSFHALGICELGGNSNEAFRDIASSQLQTPLVQPWAARTAESSNTQYGDEYLKALETLVQSPSDLQVHKGRSDVVRPAARQYGSPCSMNDGSGTGSDSPCSGVDDASDVEFWWKDCQVRLYGESGECRFACDLSQAEAVRMAEAKWNTFCIFLDNLHDSAMEKLRDSSESFHAPFYQQKVSLSLTTTLTTKRPKFASGTKHCIAQSSASPSRSSSSNPRSSKLPRRLSL